jgi:hypothetical protein
MKDKKDKKDKKTKKKEKKEKNKTQKKETKTQTKKNTPLKNITINKSRNFRDKTFKLLQTRPMKSLSLDTIEAIDLITLDKAYPPNIVGSFKYIVHEYPADIDMFESYKGCCTLKKAAEEIADKFKEMAKKIKAKEDIYLGDFKAGIDHRYYVNIGKSTNGKLHYYNPENIRKRILELKGAKLYDQEEANALLLKVIENPTIQEYNELDSALQKRYIVRWNLDELVKGEKMLPLGLRLSLEEAVSQKGVVKIDIWVYLNKRYIEMTNWYMLTYADASGKMHNLSVKPEKYESSIRKDLIHYNDPTVNKYMKLAKRLWLYAVLKNDKKLMFALYPLFSSGAAKMYQILGEIETISNILEKVQKPHMQTILENIEDWKTRLGTVMSDVLPIAVDHTINQKIDAILSNKEKKEVMIVYLNQIEEKLNDYVNRYVKRYFLRKNIVVSKYTF